MKQIFLDTETTGLDPSAHRLIEIGAVAFQDRSALHGKEGTWYSLVNPERKVPAEVVKIHGIDDTKLRGKPKFAQVADSFLEFIRGHEVLIHNAGFDVTFLDQELASCGRKPLSEHVTKITDTLQLARKLYPHSRNSLDALALRFELDLAKLRPEHGALIDARLLAMVYLRMTSGQIALALQAAAATSEEITHNGAAFKLHRLREDASALKHHQEYLRAMYNDSGVKPLALDARQKEE